MRYMVWSSVYGKDLIFNLKGNESSICARSSRRKGTDTCGGAGAAVVQQAPPQRAGGGMAAPLLAGGVGLLAGAAPMLY